MSITENRAEQRHLYGVVLGDVVYGLTADLRISQERLAACLGISPAMLSQLASAQRVGVRDPAVLHRMRVLMYAMTGRQVPISDAGRDALLIDVARMRWGFQPEGSRAPQSLA